MSGRSAGTIQTIATQEGISSKYSAPKNANVASRDYVQGERLALLNKGFDKAEDLLKSIEGAKDLQAWMIAVATGIDKRRLEDGEVTDRSERHSHSHTDLETYFEQLDAFTEINSETDSGESLDTPRTHSTPT